ncbi:MAG TPA: hypothetical protein VE967_05665 [Gemmatimonadaceae bacterium]|nr:hypothetical protein [Gemmatimonadaceae bacterium]
MTQLPASSAIAGSVLPIGRAEELITTLESVVSARIASGENGHVDAVHVLVTGELTPKQVVRNIESALMAHLGMRVDHRKISVAVTSARPTPGGVIPAAPPSSPLSGVTAGPGPNAMQSAPPAMMPNGAAMGSERQLYFEDVEVRGSRTKGSTCRVTLRHGDQLLVGEAEGHGSQKSRPELSARAALAAIREFDGKRTMWELLGIRRLEAFDASFVFVGVETWVGRERVLLTGSCEIRESAETSAALAVLDATNRWLGQQSSDAREEKRR